MLTEFLRTKKDDHENQTRYVSELLILLIKVQFQLTNLNYVNRILIDKDR